MSTSERSPSTFGAVAGQKGNLMALDLKCAERLAAVLDDYEFVQVQGIFDTPSGDFELVVTDERLLASYVIASHSDYWDFLGYFLDRKRWPVPVRPEVADASGV